MGQYVYILRTNNRQYRNIYYFRQLLLEQKIVELNI